MPRGTSGDRTQSRAIGALAILAAFGLVVMAILAWPTATGSYQSLLYVALIAGFGFGVLGILKFGGTI